MNAITLSKMHADERTRQEEVKYLLNSAPSIDSDLTRVRVHIWKRFSYVADPQSYTGWESAKEVLALFP